jgi:hypothetical protein
MRDFNNFINLYELSKTLCFELRPVGETKKMLKENKVFEKDEAVHQNYQEAKKWLDKLHREFIDYSLSDLKIKSELLEEYKQAYLDYKKEKNFSNRNNLEEKAKKLRKEILLNFHQKGEELRDNYLGEIKDEKTKNRVKKLKNLDILFKVEVFDFLKQKYPEAIVDEKSIFDAFNRFSTYFTGFHETRKNFYKEDGTATAIPTRIVNENLPKFLDNLEVYNKYYKESGDELFAGEEKNIFNLEFFNNCFSQREIDSYNRIISEINSKINQKRQTAENKNRFPFFKTLFKQILGEEKKQETESLDYIEITRDEEVFPALKSFVEENERQIPKAKKLFNRLIQDQKEQKGEFDIANVFVAGRFINQISNKYFADWNTIRSLFIEKGKKKLPEFVPLQVLKEKLQSIEIEKSDLFRGKYKDIYKNREDNFFIFLEIWQKEFEESLERYKESLEKVNQLLEQQEGYQSKENSEQKNAIRHYCENALSIYQMIKYFSLEKGKERVWNPDKLEEDPGFYELFKDYYQEAHTWQYYNEFRNYLTKKPYSQDKIKLNFEGGTLLDGWDKNKESSNLGVLLKKDGKYFLGIMQKNVNDIFTEKNKEKMKRGAERGVYKKMVYKLMADPKRDFPKGVFSKKGLKEYRPNQEILDIYNKGSFKVDSPNFSLKNMHKIIDFFKECIPKHPSWRLFNFNHVKPTREYQKNIGEFYNDLTKNTWKIWFEDIAEDYIKEKNENGELYLFEIYNKDFAKKAEGRKNLHTLYWEEIFSQRNQDSPIIKLNGQGEVFFRRASLEPEFDKERKAPRQVIDKKRYTQDKMFFHCPLTLNFARDEIRKDKNKYKGQADGFSIKIREYLTNNPDVNIIGIDRGEKHLAYYSVIDQEGNILEIDSFNIINGVDYHKKLDELEKKRDEARKTWQDIAKIKEMKQGYISQVVKKICDLIVEYNAIVVFEDLNSGFKRGRFAIEKQIYQNLELALAKKLNYLVFKNKEAEDSGSFRHAFQLTPQISNFKDVHKQCGLMFYIPASYTSAICPNCGFRKNIPTPIGDKGKNKEYLKKFDISCEKDKGRFKFIYKKRDILGEGKNNSGQSSYRLLEGKDQKNEFIFYSDVSRLQFQRSKDNRGGETKQRDPNEELKRIFEENGIDINKDINKQIKEGDFRNEDFYKRVIHTIRLILQLRNAITKKDEQGNEIEEESQDFIQCPSCHFHSGNNLLTLNSRYKGNKPFQFNGDANGAYNIARKGGLILSKISNFYKKEGDLSKMSNQDLTITQEEWDKFSQGV